MPSPPPSAEPRGRAIRAADSLAVLAAPVADVWVATASSEVRPHLVPLSLAWVEELRPVRVQAWREADEIAGRDLIRDGRWLV